MVSNTRDRNIDSSRREDSRKGQVDRCEVINVRPHVLPYPADKDFNTVDVQLIDRPRIQDKALTIKYVKLNCLQREHGLFQGNPWQPRIGDMIYVYWLAEREALVLGTCTSVEQEPVCRSQADDQQQEYVFKLCPWEEPGKNADGNFVIFPLPKHPDCFKWWPKTRESIWIFDCLEGHNCANCSSDAPCNSLDDHQSSTCFKNFSDISPTAIDKPWRFKFLHHCGSYWYFDEDGTIEIAGKLSGNLKCHQTFYPSGKILLENDVDGCQVILDDDGDIKLNPVENVIINGNLIVEEDLECNGELCENIKACIKTYCDALYCQTPEVAGSAGDVLVNGGEGPPVWNSNHAIRQMLITIDSGDATTALATGDYADIVTEIPGVILQWTLLGKPITGQSSGSAVIDLWKDTYANYDPTVADTITASAKPTISSDVKGQSSTLTGWTTSFAAGDILRLNIDSCTNLRRLTLSIKYKVT